MNLLSNLKTLIDDELRLRQDQIKSHADEYRATMEKKKEELEQKILESNVYRTLVDHRSALVNSIASSSSSTSSSSSLTETNSQNTSPLEESSEIHEPEFFTITGIDQLLHSLKRTKDDLVIPPLPVLTARVTLLDLIVANPPASPSTSSPTSSASSSSPLKGKISRVEDGTSSFYVECWIDGVEPSTPPPVNARRLSRNVESRFEVYDVSGNVRYKVWKRNIIAADTLLGVVIIPFRRMIEDQSRQEQREAGDDEDEGVLPEGTFARLASASLAAALGRLDNAMYEKEWYEIFPPPPGNGTNFLPCYLDVAGTGMDRPKPPGIGFVRLHTVLEHHQNSSLANGEATRPSLLRAHLDNPRFPLDPGQTREKLIPSSADVRSTVLHVKRQTKRLFNALNAIASPTHFAPTFAFHAARSWRDPGFSMVYFAVLASCVSSLPLFLFPLFVWFHIMVSAAMHHRHHSKTSTGAGSGERGASTTPVWSDEITRDPDQNLNPLQLINKLLFVVERVSEDLLVLTEALSRVVNAFAVAPNPRSFAVVSVGLLFVSLLASVGLYLFSPRTIALWGVILPLALPPRWFALHVVPSHAHLPSMRDVRRHPLVFRLENALSKIPTDEDEANALISEMQIVRDEEKLRVIAEIAGGT